MSHHNVPPPMMHTARTLCYAYNNDDVIFTDKISLYVNGVDEGLEKLGEVDCLIICENFCEKKQHITIIL
jgi:hypothetical protein